MQPLFSVDLPAAVVSILITIIFDAIVFIPLRRSWKKIKQKSGPMLYHIFFLVIDIILLMCSIDFLLVFLFQQK